MTNLNSFSVAGNLTGDPRIKTDENGEVRSVLFNVAVNRSKDKADFIPVRLSGTQYTAHMQQKLVKGAGVILNGRVVVLRRDAQLHDRRPARFRE